LGIIKILAKNFEQLEEKDLSLFAHLNQTVAIIVQHLAGNMLSRFTNFLTEDGEKNVGSGDEFEINNYSKQQVDLEQRLAILF
jgi:hypothetical protein